MYVFELSDELSEVPLLPIATEFEGCRLKTGREIGVHVGVERGDKPREIMLRPAFGLESQDVVLVGREKELPAAAIPDGAVSVRSLFRHDLQDELVTWIELAVEMCIAKEGRLRVRSVTNLVSFDLTVGGGFEMSWVVSWKDLEEHLERT